MRGLHFEDERYVRVYVRDTADWLSLSWEAQSLFLLLSRKLDRAGVLELGHRDPARIVARITGVPEAVVARALPELVAPEGLLELREGFLVDPAFIEAQEAKQSDAERARASREKRRQIATAAKLLAGPVTKRDESQASPDETAPGTVEEPPSPASSSRPAPPSIETQTPASARTPVEPVTNRDEHPGVTTETPGVTSLRAVPSVPCRAEGGSSTSSFVQPGLALVPGAALPAGAGEPAKKRTSTAKDPDVIRVFTFWQKDTGHERAKLDAKRANRIRARLREGFTPVELEAAIRNRRNDPWLMGEDPKSTKVFDGLDNLLRDAAQVERLLDLTAPLRRGAPGWKAQRGPVAAELERNARGTENARRALGVGGEHAQAEDPRALAAGDRLAAGGSP